MTDDSRESAQNFATRTLYHSDNLPVLRGMNTGSVDLIATDPPFKKNRDFHATPDSVDDKARFQDRWRWHEDVHEDWLRSLQGQSPAVWQIIMASKAAYGDDMAAYLSWLGVRLIEMHRVLADHGTIYLHIDHTAHAWVKTLMDAIFGRKNFRNEIVWCYSGGGIPKKDFPRKHDTLLRYSKTDDYVFNSEELRVPYDSEYQATVFAGDDTRAPGKTYRRNPNGKIVEDWWRGIPRPYGKKRTGYPTQKPLDLYGRVIMASSQPGDLVLDPFCGCATTPIAAEILERQWVGVDIWEGAHDQILERIRRNRRLLRDRDIQVTYETTPPQRTDEGESTVLELEMPKPKRRYPPPRSQHGTLLEDTGPYCQGCGADYNFDPRVLEVDHINPRSQGGTDALSNLTLLCPPCNKEKRDWLTLLGLQEVNRRNGWMKNEAYLKVHKKPPRRRRGRR